MSKHHTALRGKRWFLTRQVTFQRDGYRCRQCGRAGRLECDHVVPLERGGAPYDLANLQTLCRACHIAKTAGENRRPLTPAEQAWKELLAELT